MRKFAFALAMLASTSAFASSGSFVTTIKSNLSGYPDAIEFQMRDDGPTGNSPAASFGAAGTVVYCFSSQDAGSAAAFTAIDGSLRSWIASGGTTGLPVYFNTGTPGASNVQGETLHPGDCPGTYAYGIVR